MTSRSDVLRIKRFVELPFMMKMSPFKLIVENNNQLHLHILHGIGMNVNIKMIMTLKFIDKMPLLPLH